MHLRKRALLAVLLMAASSSASAASPTIAPEAIAQINALIAEKEHRTFTERKMDSYILYYYKMAFGSGVALGVPQYFYEMYWNIQDSLDSSKRLLVDIKGTIDPALLSTIAQFNGAVVYSDPASGFVRAWIPTVSLMDVTASAQVRRLERAATRTPGPNLGSQPWTTFQRSQSPLKAQGITGAGVKVGVIADGVDDLAQYQQAGLLPAISRFGGQLGSGTAGTALLAEVHVAAPGAELVFAGISYPSQLAAAIRALRETGCQIIVDGHTWYNEPVFQDGPLGKLVNDIVEAGVMYFGAVGQFKHVDSTLSSGAFEGDFLDANIPLRDGARIHQFRNVPYNELAITFGAPIALKWSDPYGGSSNDYDLYVLNESLTQVVQVSNDYQNGTQDPVEMITKPLPGDHVVVVKYSGGTRALHLNAFGGRLAVGTDGSVFGHNASKRAITVASGWDRTVGDDSPSGNRHMVFNQWGGLISLADPRSPDTSYMLYSDRGETYPKPDLTAQASATYDDVALSAAQAAGVAALLKSANLALTGDEITQILKSTATDIETRGVDRLSGAGLINASAAANSVYAEIYSPTLSTTLLTEHGVTFSWNGVPLANRYILTVGTTQLPTKYFGAEVGKATSWTVYNLPTDGSGVHVELATEIHGTWTVRRYDYRTGKYWPAVMITPDPRATLTSNTVTFKWTNASAISAGVTVSGYLLEASQVAVGLSNLTSGQTQTTTSATLTDIPPGEVYVRLWTLFTNLPPTYIDYLYHSTAPALPGTRLF